MKERNTVLVVDGGGRGSALVDAYAKSSYVERVIAVPGNDLMQDNTNKPVQIFPQLKTTSVPEILEICQRENVGLVDVAQDNAVAAGLVNELKKKGILSVGPTKEAGKIEWSKSWAREFGRRHNLPQPRFKIFYSQRQAIEFLQKQKEEARWFVKAAGLASGKGALPGENREKAIEKVREMKRFGKEGLTFIIEEWMEGEEFSSFIISDGKSFKIIGNAQDYKREKNGDQGENTGSMGSSSHPLLLNPRLLSEIQSIFDTTIGGLNKEGKPYKGVLYLGGMVVDGVVKIVEFNARWGDPETQVILPGITNDWFEVGMAVIDKNIFNLEIKNDGKVRVAITGAAKGYPREKDYARVFGKEIHGFKDAMKVKGVKVYGAGVKRVEGRDYVAGGRLFYVVGEGGNVIEAKTRADEGMGLISIEGDNLHHRTDIGWKDVQRLGQKGR